MRNVGRKLAFVLASSNHGTMIVNRLDHGATDGNTGVGNHLLEKASVDSLAALYARFPDATLVGGATDALRRRWSRRNPASRA